jgi:8-oxo-dGTP pyrophosphatase MutT (NUDIX family)
MTLREKTKAVVHAFHNSRLLIFSHAEHPEVGFQVPSGTVEEGESPLQAAAREFFEETGISLPTDAFRYVGRYYQDMRPFKAERHDRHVYAVELQGPHMERWTHFERHPSSGGLPEPFIYQWVPCNDTVKQVLAVGQGRMLSTLGAEQFHNIDRVEFRDVNATLNGYRATRFSRLAAAVSQFDEHLGSGLDVKEPTALQRALLEHMTYGLRMAASGRLTLGQVDVARVANAIRRPSSEYVVTWREHCVDVSTPSYESPAYLVGPRALDGHDARMRDHIDASLQWVRRLGLDETCTDHFGLIVLLEGRELFSASNSYTLSGLPSTIFADVSVSAFRMGETVLHEATHNWLNDCIAAYGIDLPKNKTWWSPWRHCQRPAQGMLQATLVFCRLLQYFYRALGSNQLGAADRLYAERRFEVEKKIIIHHVDELAEIIKLVDAAAIRDICGEELNRAINL